MSHNIDEQVRHTILALCRARYPKTICPSEAARELSPDNWRPLMPQVRAIAATLQTAGEIRITQGGKDVDPAVVRGPLRLKLNP